jgi:ribosomal RNA-processing protein 17|eukprot:scaffold2395_cov283-Chaetoceros_neogracile.AAC.23
MARTYKEQEKSGRNQKREQRGSRAKNTRKAPTTLGKRPKHEKLEIKFDPEKRKEYLTGASTRKQERRAYGLAMQKVKNRQAKIEDRREEKRATMEQIEEAEKMKNNDLFDDYESSGEESGDEDTAKAQKMKVDTYEDQSTQNQFGGQVIVTTSFGIPDDSDDEANAATKQKTVDVEQRYAGNVKRYMDRLIKKMPQKGAKFTQGRSAKKGQHGAEKMIGGNAKDLKMAQKTLMRVQGGKRGPPENGGKKGKKGKKGK